MSFCHVVIHSTQLILYALLPLFQFSPRSLIINCAFVNSLTFNWLLCTDSKQRPFYTSPHFENFVIKIIVHLLYAILSFILRLWIIFDHNILHSRSQPSLSLFSHLFLINHIHSKYREKLKSATDEKSKKETLLNIYSRFRPTFRHFFIEKFADSSMWMNARLAYTHSVAVTSIVGYILGKVIRRKEGREESHCSITPLLGNGIPAYGSIFCCATLIN